MLPLLGAEGTRKRASVPGGSCVHPPTNAPGGALALRRSGHELPDHAQRLLGLVAEDAVAGVGEDLEPRASDRLGQLVVIGEGGDRVEGAGEDQARAPDRLELAEPVVGESLAAEEVAPDLRAQDGTRDRVPIERRRVVERPMLLETISLATRSGWRMATPRATTPPKDWPRTTGCSSSSAPQKSTTSSIHVSRFHRSGALRSLRPWPRWSRKTTCAVPASGARALFSRLWSKPGPP